MKRPLLYSLVLLAGAGTAAQGQLITFSFTGAAGNETSFAPDAQPSGAFVSDMSRGSGISPSSTSGTFNSSGWTTSSGIDANDYYTFSIAPDANYSLSVSSLTLDERRSGTGIRNWSVRSSLDDFGSDLSFFSVPDDTLTRIAQSTAFGSAFESLSSAVEFRFYGFGAESGAGTWRIDNVQVNGTLTAVPEPEEYAMLASLGLLGFAAYRHIQRRRAFYVAAHAPIRSARERL